MLFALLFSAGGDVYDGACARRAYGISPVCAFTTPDRLAPFRAAAYFFRPLTFSAVRDARTAWLKPGREEDFGCKT